MLQLSLSYQVVASPLRSTVTAFPPPPNINHLAMSQKRLQYRSHKYENHEKKLGDAISSLEANPQSKLRDVARSFGIAESTLGDRLKGRRNPRREAHGSAQLLVPMEEQRLVDWILQWDTVGFPVKHKHLQQMVQAIIRARQDQTMEGYVVGNNWTNRFVKRHPEIANEGHSCHGP
jgi:hypothetical protein